MTGEVKAAGYDLETTLMALKARGRTALISYTTAGDPDLATTLTVMGIMSASGADVVELGVPFSDPLADGPVIQEAAHRALATGTNLAGVLETVSLFRKSSARQVPIILLSYYNPILAYGLSGFARDAAKAGVNGVVVPDVPPEEAGPLKAACSSSEPRVCVTFLAAPTSTHERLEVIGKSSEGFIYAVSVTGVTGARVGLPTELPASLARIRQHTSLPIAVGFGVESPEDAAVLATIADGVIIGSAVVKRLHEEGPAAVAEYISSLRRAIDRADALQPAAL